MRYEIDLAEEAGEDLSGYRAYDRIAILDLIEKHLRYEPDRESKSRIKATGLMSFTRARKRILNTCLPRPIRLWMTPAYR